MTIQTDSLTEEQESRTVIRWTDEEREMLKLWLIEHFSEICPTFDGWVVNRRNLMMAQLAILSEDRFRYLLLVNDVSDMQTRIDQYVQVTANDQIVAEHKAYITKHGLSPITHALKLQGLLQEAEGKIIDLTADRDSKNVSLETAHATISRLEAELALARKQQGGSSSTAPDLKLAICGLHLTVDQKSIIEAYGNVTWIERNHTPKDVPSLTSGRIGIVMKGACDTSMTKAIRNSAVQHYSVNGFSSLLATIQDLAK